MDESFNRSYLGRSGQYFLVIVRLDRAIRKDSGGFGGATINSEHDEGENFTPERSK